MFAIGSFLELAEDDELPAVAAVVDHQRVAAVQETFAELVYVSPEDDLERLLADPLDGLDGGRAGGQEPGHAGARVDVFKPGHGHLAHGLGARIHLVGTAGSLVVPRLLGRGLRLLLGDPLVDVVTLKPPDPSYLEAWEIPAVHHPVDRLGKIPAFKVGNSWRFRRSDLDRWIEEQTKARGGGGGGD